ncbi:MAG TPA: hypothetical protein VM075_08300 [Anaerolineae bacterium]|nr:hypothetical protein [Anaerolineae bacterium]
MTLERYSRPNNDTGYGFHYYPDTEHYSTVDIKRWLPELQTMGASWLVVLSELEGPIPEFFVGQLIDSEIEPIVRVMTPAIQPLDRSSLRQLLRTYAARGVHYVEVFSEPNRASRWPLQDWCRQSLVQRFLEMLLPCLEEMQAVGLHPVFPALRPGGDYWDLAFLQSSLELLASEAGESLFQNMAIGMHNDDFDRPLFWGDGGQDRWFEARPYSRPEGSQDHIGHNLFEWYDEIVKSTLGQSLGLLSMGSMANGYPGRLCASAWTDQEAQAERALAIGKRVMDGEVPSYVINHTYWLLAAEEEDANTVQAWYDPQGEGCQAVSAMKGLLKHSRPNKDQQRASEAPALVPRSVTGVEFVGLSREMIDRLQIEGPSFRDRPYWKVIRVEVKPGTQNMSAYAIADADTVRFSWPDGEYIVSPKDDPYAPAGARQRAASMPMFAAWGGYSVEVLGNSQVLRGFGLYGDNLELTQGRNHPVLVTFVLADPSGEDPVPIQPDPPSPAPQPVPPAPLDPPSPAPRPPASYGGFARPPKDNGMGVHFGLNTTTEAIALDIARAKEMRLTWGTLCYQGEEQLIRCAKMMWDAGIMPVCRQVLSINRRHPFGRDAQVLAEHGIPAYIQIFNEPSDEREWERDRPRDYKEKWAGLWAEKAEDVYNSGGYPGLQCLSLAELEAAIDAVGVGSPVWQRVWFCSHNYALNHPPDWKGDVWCVQGFQFFADVFQRRLGFVPPIICGEGGWLYGASDDPRFARVVGEIHAKYTRHVYKWFRRGKVTGGAPLPDYLFAVCPWILSGPSDEAWYGYTTKELTIQEVKSIPEFVRIRTASTECGGEG